MFQDLSGNANNKKFSVVRFAQAYWGVGGKSKNFSLQDPCLTQVASEQESKNKLQGFEWKYYWVEVPALFLYWSRLNILLSYIILPCGHGCATQYIGKQQTCLELSGWNDWCLLVLVCHFFLSCHYICILFPLINKCRTVSCGRCIPLSLNDFKCF
jgi:hypothetical protein